MKFSDIIENKISIALEALRPILNKSIAKLHIDRYLFQETFLSKNLSMKIFYERKE